MPWNRLNFGPSCSSQEADDPTLRFYELCIFKVYDGLCYSILVTTQIAQRVKRDIWTLSSSAAFRCNSDAGAVVKVLEVAAEESRGQEGCGSFWQVQVYSINSACVCLFIHDNGVIHTSLFVFNIMIMCEYNTTYIDILYEYIQICIIHMRD